ncbi:hypothetical protein COLO4_07472 [Corchorus olitorius]|uniref:Uncharacterized protein n=1 Tax=Corchorus olitorius TaxID=93759 RepID=A0A1R3KJQ3_9ROSI|nr:hypothetical protein COLO4_07472 [Corchorus olitorius]
MDLSRAKFGSGPEPDSGFSIAVVVDGELTLLVGDSTKEAYARTRAHKPVRSQALVLRMVLSREHVFGSKVYNTKARFGGKSREISCFSIDNQRVLQIKRFKWKFRGNERIEFDGVSFKYPGMFIIGYLIKQQEDQKGELGAQISQLVLFS